MLERRLSPTATRVVVRASREASLQPGSFSNEIPKGLQCAALAVEFSTSGTNFGCTEDASL